MKLIIDEKGEEYWVQHGNGKQIWPDGAEYSGYWDEGKMQGFGNFLHANRDVYEGNFINDKANGKGVYT